ncbi:hypothetical protein ACFQ0B_43515 [Nonomuraea thailandensis]
MPTLMVVPRRQETLPRWSTIGSPSALGKKCARALRVCTTR